MELKFNTAQVSKERRMSKYFGSEEAQSPSATPQIRSSLEFDDQGVENISKLVFKGMKVGQNK